MKKNKYPRFQKLEVFLVRDKWTPASIVKREMDMYHAFHRQEEYVHPRDIPIHLTIHWTYMRTMFREMI